jgi:hypothetical protein
MNGDVFLYTVHIIWYGGLQLFVHTIGGNPVMTIKSKDCVFVITEIKLPVLFTENCFDIQVLV